VAEITEATEVDDELVSAMARLVRQLSRSAPEPTVAEVAEMVGSPASRLLVARPDGGGPIIGTLTLAVFRIPTGVRAWIEDVVVDEAGRSQGVGTALITAALRVAAEVGARTVDLTSRPSREAANRLYRSLGFVLRETNVYRVELRS